MKNKKTKEDLHFDLNAFELSLKPTKKSFRKLLALSDKIYEAAPEEWRGPRPSSFDLKLLSYTAFSPYMIYEDIGASFKRILEHRLNGSKEFNFSIAGLQSEGKPVLAITPPRNHADWNTLGGLKVYSMMHPKLNRAHPCFSGVGDKVDKMDEDNFVEIYDFMRQSKNLMSPEVLSLSWVHIDLFYPNTRITNFDQQRFMKECGHLFDLIKPVKVSFKHMELQGFKDRCPRNLCIRF